MHPVHFEGSTEVRKPEDMTYEQCMSLWAKIGYANAIIAKFMGFDVVDVGYSDSEEETEWQRNHDEWMNTVGLTQVGRYIVNVKENIWHPWDDVKYHSSWDSLMLVWFKIQTIGADMGYIFKKYHEAFHAGIDHQSIAKCHSAVYQFIQWYNKQSNTTNEHTTGND